LLSCKEMKIAYERLFARLRDIRLAPDMEPPRYFESILYRGFESLHLQFDQRR